MIRKMNEIEELEEMLEIAKHFEDFEAVKYYEEEINYYDFLVKSGQIKFSTIQHLDK